MRSIVTGGAASSTQVEVGSGKLPGILNVPAGASALIIFTHGSGSSLLSLRNRQVAEALNDVGLATLLFDLLRPDEEQEQNRAKVFDIPLLTSRLVDAVHWADTVFSRKTPLGLFGASTGAAAALAAAAQLSDRVKAVVSRGGRPELAGSALEQVRSPTLLIVGSEDSVVLELNHFALAKFKGLCSLEVVPGATHLFPEPGAMERVIVLARDWFERYLADGPV